MVTDRVRGETARRRGRLCRPKRSIEDVARRTLPTVMRRLVTVPTLVAAVVVGAVALPSAHAFDEAWTTVATGTTGGISGIAPHAGSGWVIVRDNKSAGQNRVALLSDGGVVTPLAWPGTQPQDLEALAAVPDSSDYAALTSAGRGYLLALGGTSVTVQRTFTVPRGKANIESFALARLGGQIVAVWATRGSVKAAAKVFTATFTPSTGKFGRVAKGSVSVPYPTVKVRQIADLAVVDGRLIGSSTSDPGAKGPFASALYDLGSVTVRAGRAQLALQTPASLGRFDGHKIEGIACAGGSGLLGSDDEKFGAAVRTTAVCASP
jgi:hypothetical protein